MCRTIIMLNTEKSCPQTQCKCLLASHHEMLEEPGAHDVGGVFGQDSPLVLRLLVFTVQQGGQVHIYLYSQTTERKERGRKEKREKTIGLSYCCHGNKLRLPITFFFLWQGQKHLLKCHHGN